MEKKILILAANPRNTNQLRLDEEVREIEEGLKRAKDRDKFVVYQKWAVRVKDVRRSLLDIEPHIVHFCGHGETSGLILEDDTGNAVEVTNSALKNLFELFDEIVEIVVLNSCYSENQAMSISEHINVVVGINNAIGDKAAIEFAIGFYDAIGAGKNYEQAFKFGCNSIELNNINENNKPKIHNKKVNNSINQAVKINPKESESNSKTTNKKELLIDIEPLKKEIFIDPRDGQKYKYATINGCTWMTQNLNFDTGRDCWYPRDKNNVNIKKHGRLYTWDAAKKACPPGWKLPSDTDWKNLAKYYGGYYDCEGLYFHISDLSVDGKYIGSDTDLAYRILTSKSNLDITLSGYRDYLGSYFTNEVRYWTDTPGFSLFHKRVLIFQFRSEILRNSISSDFALPCRCVKI